MSWLVLILISVNLSALVSLFDKFYCSKKVKSIYSFAFLVNFFYLVFILVTTYILRKSFVFNWLVIYPILSGLTYFLTWIFWWKAMTTSEVSRVVGVASVQPVINAILAVFFLNEVISVNKWSAIILIVAGAFLCSWEKKKNGGFNKAYLYVLVAVCFGAVGNILVKFSMGTMPALVVNCLSFYATFPLFLLMLKDKKVFQEVKKNLLDKKSSVPIFFRSLIGYLAICFYMLAVGAGPVSSVVTVNNAAPLLVFVYSIGVSFFWPKIIKEELSRQALFTKTIAIIMIVVGAMMISTVKPK